MLGSFVYEDYQRRLTECCPLCGKWNIPPIRLVNRDMIYFGQQQESRQVNRTVFGETFETTHDVFYDLYATFIQCAKCHFKYYVIYKFLYVKD